MSEKNSVGSLIKQALDKGSVIQKTIAELEGTLKPITNAASASSALIGSPVNTSASAIASDAQTLITMLSNIQTSLVSLSSNLEV